MSDVPAILTQNLGRVYKLRGPKHKGDPKQIVALQGVNLRVERGELFGLLGPNGAGKTTLIKILTTLLLPTSGTALVEGLDVTRDAQEIRRRISMVSGGETSGYGLLTVEENLWMFARFYGLETKVAKQRIGELLEVVGLSDRRRTKISDLSTGLRQKMNFVRGFISDPDVVFLDEPTLGLDVTAARQVRDFVRAWMEQHPDRTLLLTTHYMAEADELCDRLAIIDKGRLLALDTPANLKRRLRRETVFTLRVIPLGQRPMRREDMIEAVPGVRQVTVRETDGATELKLILEAEDALGGVLDHLTRRGSGLIALEKREPTLEDVFIDLVGRGLDVDTSERLNGSL
ncbi:MAG: ATP-binding cassette domain-containing protein [Caldilineales bacterium]|nr:ATP-binding cassette domain-containing protein [Caldilineales bacterium]MDW8317789.1 ATP-binding cassette domain-containing protein [Anaerolineae bacterium]